MIYIEMSDIFPGIIYKVHNYVKVIDICFKESIIYLSHHHQVSFSVVKFKSCFLFDLKFE